MTESDGEEFSYSTLLGRLLKDGERFAKARLKLYRALAYYRFAEARGALVMLLVATLLTGAGFVALLMGLVNAIAWWTGPLLAGIIVALVAFGVAGLLVSQAVKRMPDLSELPFEEDDVIRGETVARPGHVVLEPENPTEIATESER